MLYPTRILFGFLLALIVTTFNGLSQTAVPWHLASAPYRISLTVDKAETKTQAVSSVRLHLPITFLNQETVAIFSASGVVSSLKILHLQEGEPTTLLFDSGSGESIYYLYFGGTQAAPKIQPAWNPQSGITLETRRFDGKAIHDLESMLSIWKASSPSLGCSLVNCLFHGLHIHGPLDHTLSHYQGWFEVTEAGRYEFTTMSTDASFILIDGKPVVSWPGKHNFHPGLRGEFNGGLDLTAGKHLLEYYNAYSLRERVPLVCVAGWRKKSTEPWQIMMPQNPFFVPLSRFHVNTPEMRPLAPSTPAPQAANPSAPSPTQPTPTPEPPAADLFYMSWEIKNHSIPNHLDTSNAFVTVQLRAYRLPKKGTARWIIDNGTPIDNPAPLYTFASTGLKEVTLQVVLNKVVQSSTTQKINIHANWQQREPIIQTVYDAQIKEIMARDLSKITTDDLTSIATLVTSMDNTESINALSDTLISNSDKLTPKIADVLLDAANQLKSPPLQKVAQARKLQESILTHCKNEKMRVATLLDLTEVLVRYQGDYAEAMKRVGEVEKLTLSPAQKSRMTVLKTETVLGLGKLDEAQQIAQAAFDKSPESSARSSVRRIAKLDSARHYIDTKQYDPAEKLLQEALLENPSEALSTDVGLMRIEVHRALKESAPALLLATRLLPISNGPTTRSQLLYVLADLQFESGKKVEAEKSLGELMKKHAYSEAAARAKERWPDQWRKL